MFKQTHIKTPSYIIDTDLLKNNLKKLKDIQDRCGCKILLAQKGFSIFSLYPMMKPYLYGTTASSLHEAKLGYEEMGGEVHIFSPAYVDEDFDEISGICDHIIFNSFDEWNRFKDKVKNNLRKIECGIRINPEYSEIEHDIYNPCFKFSRLGTTADKFYEGCLDGIDGLHFHTMCEQNSDVLWRTVQVIDEKFGKYIKQVKWLNFGGGHHITREDYDVEKLIKSIEFIKNKYNVAVYLEPGEAVALNTGFLAAKILGIVDNGMKIAILDASAACHMPDVLEMPYRPNIIDADFPDVKKYTYRLAGNTCLAGDIIGDYSFDAELAVGDILFFCDMAHYSMVKNNTFNGMKLPSIAVYSKESGLRIIKEFSYLDFKNRLS